MNVTLAFAQSLDGCITARPGQPTALSGSQALAYTHELRAAHDAIVVGVGTVIADDPRLTVRLAPGAHPQPVVLDANLRIPLSCRLLTAPVRPLWILCGKHAPMLRRRELEARGACVLPVFEDESNAERWPLLLHALSQCGMRSVMVEGGARVITSLLESGAAQRLSLTIAPRFLAAVRGVHESEFALPALQRVRYRPLGDDLIVEADLVSSRA
jgi:GTP cyclohydrolase II